MNILQDIVNKGIATYFNAKWIQFLVILIIASIYMKIIVRWKWLFDWIRAFEYFR
jgi:hypothetical protein